MTKFSLLVAAAILAISLSTTDAWTTSSSSSEVSGRRQFLGGAMRVGTVTAAAFLGQTQVANAATAKTGAASPFTGFYDDPNHPNCLRQVKVVGAPLRADGSRSAYPVIEITGYDGNGGGNMCTERPTRADLWKVEGTVTSSTQASVDFSPKGGPTKLVAKFEDNGIVFPDGNKWVKLPYVTKDRLPSDMSTLKSD